MAHVPDWYRDSKLGIMVHWGLPSVPAFAPTEHGSISEILRKHDWEFHFKHNPYSEWYQNSLRVGAPATVAFHRKSYKPGYAYERFAEQFNDRMGAWDPAEWANLFAEAGARYVVLVTKHHDGFLMWPSEHRPSVDNYTAARDVVGELAQATRERGMKYGLYYSGLLDWTVQTEPIREFADLLDPFTTPEYAQYVDAHFRELITSYKPDILWNDIGLTPMVDRAALFQDYRANVPQGVTNDRWSQTGAAMRRLLKIRAFRRWVGKKAQKAVAAGQAIGTVGDVPTVEYGVANRLQKHPWEAVRSIGNSFAYNAQESDADYLSGEELAQTLCDIVSKNGNLLLNIGPDSRGRVPEFQRRALLELSEWIRDNGEAIYDTRPWFRAEGLADDRIPVRFTTRRDVLYAIVLERPARLTVRLSGIDFNRIPRLTQSRGAPSELDVSLLGFQYPIDWSRVGDHLEVRVPGSFVPKGPMVFVLRFGTEEAAPPKIDMYTDVIG